MSNCNLRIGIVLSSVPSYSETFFINKINGLAELGYKIVLFAKGSSKDYLKCEVVNPYPVLNNIILKVLLFLIVLLVTGIRAPKALYRFYQLESKEGESLIKILKLIYLNAHILPYKFDWISFGFATQTLGKEVVAMAIGAKMSISLRGFDINVYPLFHPGCYSKMWKYVHKVHVLSEDLKRKAIEYGMPLTTEVVKITPAINTEFFNSDDRFFLFNAKQKILIVTVARLHWIKGLEYALEACKILKSEGLQFSYKIIGEGDELEKLTFLRDQMGLNEEVEFMGKRGPREIKKLMQTALIYLQTSLQEGFCNAVIEAQAMKCLCIVTDAGGLCENVLHNQTGWIIPKRNPQAIADMIIQIINMPQDFLEQVRSAARKRVLSEFLLEKHLQSWISYYQS